MREDGARGLLPRLGRDAGAGRATGVLRVWKWWERIDSWMHPSDLVPGSSHGVLRVRLLAHRGDRVELPDGTTVRPGDLVGEIHLDNETLVSIAERSKWQVLPVLREELHAAAVWLTEGRGSADLVALTGYTVLARATVVLGFMLRDRPITVNARLHRLYLGGLLQIYSHLGATRLERGSRALPYPAEIWMSRAELLRRYL